MAAGRFIVGPYFPARDQDNVLSPGALLYVYENGTTTKATIYTDEAMTVLSSNPVIANASGQFPAVWGEAGTADVPVGYTVMVTASDGSSLGTPSTFDNFYPSLNWENANITLAEAAATAAEGFADDAEASAIEAAASAASAAADLAEIESIAAGSPDAPSIVNKANLNGDNVSGSNATAFRTALGAASTAALAAETGSSLIGFLQTGTSAVSRTVANKLQEVFSVKDFGAVGDTQEVTGNVTASSTTFTRTSGATFTSADVGKTIALPGAGAAGANLTTTIAGYTSSSVVTLTVAPSTSVTGCAAVFGTDDTAEIQACINAAISGNRTPGRGNVSRRIYFPSGSYLHSGLSFGSTALTQLEMSGDGEGQTYLVCSADNGPHFTTPAATVWGWRVKNMTARWTTPANASKTSRAFFTFPANGIFNSEFANIRCGNGHYIYLATGGGNVWGCRMVMHSFFDMTGGFCDLTGITGEPNMRIEQVYGSCQVTAGPVFIMRGSTCQYDNVELNDLDLGPVIIQDSSGGNHIIGTMAFEQGAWANANRYMFDLQNSTLVADYIYFFGTSNTVTQPTYMFRTSGTGSIVVKLLDVVTQVSGSGALYFAANGTIVFDRAPRLLGSGTPTPYGTTLGLNYIGGSTAADTLWCNEWGNPSNPVYNADADVTLTYSSPVVQVFRASITTNRTVTLPASGNNLFSGRPFIISKLTKGGGGDLLIKTSGGTTLATIPNASTGQVTVMFNRAISGGPSNTWEVTDVQISQTFFDGSKTYDPGSLADGAGETTTVTATGAALGDYVAGVSFSLDLQGITTTAWVSAANTVSVRFQNETGGTIDLASGTLRVRVAQQ